MRTFSAISRLSFTARAFIATLFAGCLLQLLAGCLDAERSISIRYDATRDQYTFLTIYHHIRVSSQTMNGSVTPENAPPVPAETKEELQRLLALYRNRDHLMLGPFAFNLLSGETQYLRLSDTQAARIDLSQSGEMQLLASPIHLNDITILPGELFLNGPDDLCYYHQIVVPGPVADDAIAFFNDLAHNYIKENPTDFFSMFDAELARRKEGEPAMPWDDFSPAVIALMLKQIDGTSAESPHLNPLDSASLQGLRDALAERRLKIFRRGGMLALRVPLTQRDVTGITAFWPELRKALQAKAKEPLKEDAAKQLKQLNIALDSLSISAIDATTLEITVDVVKIAQAIPTPVLPDLDAQNRVDAQAMAHQAVLQLEVNKTQSVEKIQSAFAAGTLTAHPSQTPVKPGTDLGNIQSPAPTTQK